MFASFPPVSPTQTLAWAANRICADLAWLLTSPSLIDETALPGVALGDAALGKAWLKASAPGLADADLTALGHRPGTPFRLGRYAETLMEAALRASPDRTFLGQGVVVQAAHRTLGEFDFLLQEPDQQLMHIELAVKIYLAVPQPDSPALLVGPGLRDALPLKLRALQRQCRLAQTPEGRAALSTIALSRSTLSRSALPMDTGPVATLAWVRGWIFYPMNCEGMFTENVAADAPLGWWRVWNGTLPARHAHGRWRCLDRPDWLAPGHAGPSAISKAELETALTRHFHASATPVLVAEYPPAERGEQELSRGFVMPPGWPDTAGLAALQQRIDALRTIP